MRQNSFFRKLDFTRSNTGQGTIEYLVIIAIVIVISLVVVGLVTSTVNSPMQSIGTDSTKVSSYVGVGGISISEAVVDASGDGIINLNNFSGEVITLNSVSAGDFNNSFRETIVSNDARLLHLSDLNSVCPCTAGMENQKCAFDFNYTTSSGLNKLSRIVVLVNCVAKATSKDTNKVVNPIEQPDVENLCDNRLAGGYFFSGDGSTLNPYGICDCQMLQDMNNYMDANYVLLNNIDCTETRTWNLTQAHCHDSEYNGFTNQTDCENDELYWYPTDYAGFSPVGSCGPAGECGDGNYAYVFKGSLDGQDYNINNLYINNFDKSNTGLFGYVNNGRFNSIWLYDANVIGTSSVGSLVGSGYSISVRDSFSSGAVSCVGDCGYVGGLIGSNQSLSSVNSSFSFSNVSGSEYQSSTLGGLVGDNTESSITDSFSKGTVFGAYRVGGLVGDNGNNSTITDSYATGAVVGLSGFGGLVGENSGTVSNSFSTGIINSRQSGEQFFIGDNMGSIENSYWFSNGDNSAHCYNNNGYGDAGCNRWGGLNSAYEMNYAPLVDWNYLVWNNICDEYDYPSLMIQNVTSCAGWE